MPRPGRLIIRYAPSAKAQDAQWAYVGRYLFYYVCQKLSFCDAPQSFYWAKRNKNINRNFEFCKKIHSCPNLRNYTLRWRAARLNLSLEIQQPVLNLEMEIQ